MDIEKHRKLEPAAMLLCGIIQSELSRPPQVHPISNLYDEAFIDPTKIGDVNQKRFHLSMDRDLRVLRTSEVRQTDKMNGAWGCPV